MSVNQSVSRQRFRLQIVRKGDVILNLYKHLSPLTLLHLSKKMPYETHAIRQRNTIVMPFNIIVGKEKTRDKYKRGDVVYSPQDGAIIIFLHDTIPSRTYNIIGEVENGIELLDSIKYAESIRIEKIE
ncbi:MAG: cyclophilin-like fold protein [Nitrososphaeria archaeon]|nr:cyclophilin-like fold protein [Nitrososphaeria archaeon]